MFSNKYRLEGKKKLFRKIFFLKKKKSFKNEFLDLCLNQTNEERVQEKVIFQSFWIRNFKATQAAKDIFGRTQFPSLSFFLTNFPWYPRHKNILCVKRVNTLADGGGIQILGSGGIHTLTDCIFENNQALNGGALSVKGQANSISILNCQFNNNQARGNGGALFFADQSRFLKKGIL